ncbi:MAG: hypothetical protein U5O39_05445 [Gammaproteobacteria bacterium]|nr:hypothetical protein [Gammaproteobacteria bacterium]
MLGAMGARLTLAAGDGEALDDLARQIAEAGGVVQTVNRRPDSVEDTEAIIEQAVDTFGSVDMLIVASGLQPAWLHPRAATGGLGEGHECQRSWSVADGQGVRQAGHRPGEQAAKFCSSHRCEAVTAITSGYTAYCASKGATECNDPGAGDRMGTVRVSPSMRSHRPCSDRESRRGCSPTMSSDAPHENGV